MKRKLFLLLCALLTMIGVQAQTDVTSQYLTNADFATGTPIDNGVCTYGKDMAANNTTYYGAQPIVGWTNASEGVTDQGYENCGLAAALYAYGESPFLAGAGFIAPVANPSNMAGNAAGLCAVWNNKVQYTQDVTLPAGSYTIKFQVYNATSGSGNSSGVISTDLFGFKANAGTEYYAPNNTFAIGQWSTVAVSFNLTEETAGVISMGFVGPGGNAAMPHLFVDNVKILSNDSYLDCTNQVGKTSWSGVNDGYQGGAINTARQYGDKSVGRHLYQTVTGLENGNYEVTLYSISQKEWNGTLPNDAGDVAYVFAEGTSEIREYINARARATYPGDENLGIYTISGVKVSDGTLTIGMGLTQANLTEWHHIQIKSLVRTNDPDLSDLIEGYENALTAANAVDQTQQMGASVKAALNTTINTYGEGKVDKKDADALVTATAALSTATTAANNSIASYAELQTAIANAQNYTIYKPVFTAGVTIYTGAIGAAQGVYTAAEVDNCSDAITALTNGIHSAYESDYGTFADSYPYSYSSLLNEDLTKWTSTDYVTMTANEHWNGLTGQRYYEQSGAEWGQSSWSHKASQTAILPAGSYVMSITARASADVTSSMTVKIGDNEPIVSSLPHKGADGRGIMTNGVGSYQDGTYAKGNAGYGWEYRFIEFTLTEETPVTFGFNSSTNAQYNWVSIANPLLKGNVHPNQMKVNEIKALAATLSSYNGKIPTAAFATFADDIAAGNAVTVDTPDLDGLYSKLENDITTAESFVAPYATAKSLLETASELTVGYDKLQQAVVTYSSAIEYFTTVEQLEEFNGLLATANSTFSAWLDMKAYANALVAVPSNNSVAKANLTAAIETDENNVQNATIDPTGLATITSSTENLKDAMTTYAEAADPVGETSKFDLTFMLTNPDLTGYSWVTVPGWYTDQTFGVQNSQAMYTEGEGYYYEYWSDASCATSGYTVYQKVTLPEGTYEMTAKCKAGWGYNQSYPSGSPTAITFSVNETDGTSITSPTLEDASIEFVNKTPGEEVKIGLKAHEGNTSNWMGIGYVKLYKVPANAFTLDEDAAWDYNTSGAGKVTLKRTIKEGINTVVFPFSMTQDEITENFGDGSVVYVASSYNSATENISFAVSTDGISPNKPCLLKATVAGSYYEIEGRTIVAATSAAPEFTTDDNSVTMIGGYDAENAIVANQDNYVISDGKIYLVDTPLSMKATRAYIKVVDANAARELILDLDGEATVISAIEAAEDNDGELKDGKYFIDGKIVIVNNGVKYSANGQILK